MNKNKPIAKILQEVITEKELGQIVEKHGYKDVGRKMTVMLLLRYFLLGAMVQSKSYRELAVQGQLCGLKRVDYSTLSKKATEVPFMIFIDLFHLLFKRSNRGNKRKLRSKCGRIIKIIDSTRIIAAESKWDWGKYKDKKSGIKFHIGYMAESGVPEQIEVSPIGVGDSVLLDKFRENDTLLLCDRGYLNIEKMCKFDYVGQEFILRMREGINQLNRIDFDIAHDPKYQDHLCTLGKDRRIPAEYRNHQFRVINFHSKDNELISLCTNVMDLSADEIAYTYKTRWNIETFFRELKQNFTIKTIFGKSQNSAFSQGVIAFISYFMLFTLYTSLAPFLSLKDTFLSFLRNLRCASLPCHPKTFYALFYSIFS